MDWDDERWTAPFTGKRPLFTENRHPLAGVLLTAGARRPSFDLKSTVMNELENKIEERYVRKHSCQGSGGRMWTGVFILLIGIALLLNSLYPSLPDWIFSWQMILIALGLFIGIRHQFRGGAWLVLLLIGSVFLLDDFFPALIESRFIWPLAFIVVGLFLVIRPRRRPANWAGPQNPEEPTLPARGPEPYVTSNEDVLESTSVFGGIKKSLLSKNFKGGEIVNIMGGAEINLSQADIQGRAELEVTQIFGGTKIIVPAHWDVKPEMAAIFGGIDDKRLIQNAVVDHSKVLVLKGTSVFGGIEIKSF